MPVISYSRSEFNRILGWDISEEELDDVLQYLKAELESVSDEELEFEISADRMDMVTLEGLVRAIKGVKEIELGAPKYEMRRGALELHVGEAVSLVRPYIVAAVVRDVDLTTEESLISMIEAQEKLHDTIGRKRRRVSIGLHDFSKVRPPLYYDAKPAKEVVFVPLGEYMEMTAEEVLEQLEKGREYRHLVENEQRLVPVFYDSRGEVLSLPPIINSELTRITPGTRDILIDVTGTDLKAVSYTLEIIASSLAERGGRIEGFYVLMPGGEKLETPKPDMLEMVVQTDFVRRIVGIEMTAEEMVHQLRRARLDANAQGDSMVRVLIPGFRADFLHPADVAEEVAVAYGLNRLGHELPRWVMTVGRRHLREKISLLVRTVMIGLGYQEVLNYIMTSRRVLFDSVGRPPAPVVEVANPVSESYSVLRDSLYPGLLHFLAANTHVSYPQRIFEIGDVIVVDPSFETRARDERRLAAAIADNSVGFEDIHSHLKALSDAMSWGLRLLPHDERPFLKGRCAKIEINGSKVGIMGEVDPEVLLNLGITVPVALFELKLLEG